MVAMITCDWSGTATPASESTRGAMKSPIQQCALLLVAFTVWAEPVSARNYLNCVSKKVIIVDAPSGSSSLSAEENIGFWIDEAAKIITLSDGGPLIVRRFDDRWISAARSDVSYEIDRQNDILTYASPTTTLSLARRVTDEIEQGNAVVITSDGFKFSLGHRFGLLCQLPTASGFKGS
jgi:hypothetical protein